MHFMPRSKIGKWLFWISIVGVLMIYIPFWFAMAFDISIPIPSGFVAVMLVTLSGICSMVLLFGKDRAIALIISALLGLFGIFMIVGELVFPH